MNRRKFSGLALWATLGHALTAPARAADTLTIFAAASLKNALDAVAAAWAAEGHAAVAISYAASSALAKQITEGAPADIFISADTDWMDKLSSDGLLDKGTIAQLLGNELVLIAPADGTASIAITPGFDLAGLVGDGKLAMADVTAVPAGKYGKAALESLGAWDGVAGKVAMAENVRAALKLVATGEAPFGIVYATDAVAEKSVRVIGTFPAESHPPIIYPVARVATSRHGDAAAFQAFLRSEKAQAIFKGQGFQILPPDPK